MADDNILRVGAEFDVAPLIAGAQQAGAAFDQMKVKFVGLAAEAETAGKTVMAQGARFLASGMTLEQAAQALTELGVKANIAAREVVAVASAAGMTGPQLENLAKAATGAGSGFGAMSAKMGEARVVMGGLEGSTGMMAGGLARLAASSQALSPLIEAAFPIFGVVAFIAILDVASKALQEATDSLTGWDAEAKKAYAEAAAANLEQINRNIENNAKLREQGEIGLEGTSKQTLALKNLTTEQKDWSSALSVTTREINEVQSKLDHLQSFSEKAITFAVGLGDMSKLNDDVKQLEEQLKRLQNTQKEQAEKITSVGIEIPREHKTLAVDQAKQTIEAETAAAAATRTIQEAQVSFAEDVTKREYQAFHISLEQETADLRNEENRKIEILRASFDSQEKILRQRHAETGEDITPKISALHAQREAAETKHKQTLYDIDAEGQREGQRIEQQRALHAIEVDRQIAEADDNLATHKAELALRKADTPATMELAATEYTKLRTQAIEDQITAIRNENAVLNQAPKNQQDQIADPAMAAKFSENVAKINQLRIEQQTVAIDTAAETTKRVNEFHAQELNEQISAINKQTKVTEDGEKRRSETIRTEFENRQISARRYIQEVGALAEQEYTDQAAAFAKEMELVKAAAASRVLTEEEAAKKLQELWNKEHEAYQQMLNQMNSAQDQANKKQQQSINNLANTWAQDFTKMTNEVLTTNTKVSVAFAQMGRQMELQLIDNGIKRIITETTQSLAQLVLAWVKTETSIAAAQKAGSTTSTATAVPGLINVAKTAASDAVTVFHQVISTVPFPANVVLAPLAAAGIFAAEIAIGGGGGGGGGGAQPNSAGGTDAGSGGGAISAEHGAIVPANMPMFAHAKEMVLPAPISTAIQGAVPAIHRFNASFESGGIVPSTGLAMVHQGEGVLTAQQMSNINNSTRNNSNSVTSQRGDTHIHIAPREMTMTHEDIVRAVRTGIRKGELGRSNV